MTVSPSPTVTDARLPQFLRALRHRNYRLFFIGQLISLIGTWMQSVAQGWLVLRLTDSPALLGIVAAASSLPVLLFSLPAGTVVDRVSKQKLLLATQVAAMLLAISLAVLTISGLIQVWHILVMAMLLGFVNAFDAPTRQSFTVEMVGREDLLNAIALNSSIFNAARMIGPAVAGLLVALIGEGPAFALNAVSFVFVIASLLMMRLPPFTAPKASRSSDQLKEGLRYLKQEPRVQALLIQAMAISLFCFVHIPLLPVFARDVLGTGAAGLGALSSASGLGALIAALILAQLGDKLRRGRLLIFAALLYPLL
ncbi:MAG: MFS transporter, partial [Chloroflexia bacterium]|nr:MFS transporter [Chloroflexia bacterium]